MRGAAQIGAGSRSCAIKLIQMTFGIRVRESAYVRFLSNGAMDWRPYDPSPGCDWGCDLCLSGLRLELRLVLVRVATGVATCPSPAQKGSKKASKGFRGEAHPNTYC